MATRSVEITSTVKNLVSESDPDLTAGSWYMIQNRGDRTVFLYQGSSAPDLDDVDNKEVHTLEVSEKLNIKPTSSEDIYAWITNSRNSATVAIVEAE